MRIAYVHDWLVTWRGGEKVLEALLSLYPDAPVYTLFYDPSAMPPTITKRDIRASRWLNRLRPFRKALLPILPNAIEHLDLSSFDLVISTSSCVAKGAVGRRHLCYLHSPMRYIWDQQEAYLEGLKRYPGVAPLIRSMTPRLRRWDVASAQRVDRFIANSRFVAERTRRFYNRQARVIHPPIDLNRFRTKRNLDELGPSNLATGDQQTDAVIEQIAEFKSRGPYFIAAGALVTYKRFDLAIAASKAAGNRLVIAGSGPLESQLREQLRHELGAHGTLVVAPNDDTFTDLLQNAEALLFPGIEDFGMIAVESMAAGTPVIAYEAGGALDFIKAGVSGKFFKQQTAESLAQAISTFERTDFRSDKIDQHVSQFGLEAFLKAMQNEIKLTLEGVRL